MSLSIVSLVVLLILLLVALWAVAGIWRAIRGWEMRCDRARCAKCEYPVEGLSSWTCPECGSNLLRVGILGTHQDLKRRNIAAEGCAGWCILSLFLAPLTIRIFNLQNADYATALLLVIWLGLTAIGSGVIMLLRQHALRKKRAREAARAAACPQPLPPPSSTAPNQSAA